MSAKTPFLVLVIAIIGLAQPVIAQDRRSQEPSWAEMQRQMQEMQRQMMQELQKSPFFRGDWMMPDSTGSSFFFRIDTSFNNDPHAFFRNLFGDDFEADFFGFDSPRRAYPDGTMPPDDGNLRERGRGDGENDDELLPEERLRQQQQSAGSDARKNKPSAKNQGLKTIRI